LRSVRRFRERYVEVHLAKRTTERLGQRIRERTPRMLGGLLQISVRGAKAQVPVPARLQSRVEGIYETGTPKGVALQAGHVRALKCQRCRISLQSRVCLKFLHGVLQNSNPAGRIIIRVFRVASGDVHPPLPVGPKEQCPGHVRTRGLVFCEPHPRFISPQLTRTVVDEALRIYISGHGTFLDAEDSAGLPGGLSEMSSVDLLGPIVANILSTQDAVLAQCRRVK